MNKNKTFKAVFFDFGGTLMDSESDKIAHLHLMKELKKHYQINLSEEQLMNKYQLQLFNSDMTLKDYPDKRSDQFNKLSFYSENAFRSLLNLQNIQLTNQDIKWFNKIHLDNHLKYIQLVEGTWDAIRFIKEKGFHCGIISDIDTEYLVVQFKALKLTSVFHSITTSEEAKHYKPNPHIFKTALKKANCEGREAIMIGDSYNKDIVGGKNMNMTTIWINRYQKYSDKTNLADYTIRQLKEIRPILNDLLES